MAQGARPNPDRPFPGRSGRIEDRPGGSLPREPENIAWRPYRRCAMDELIIDEERDEDEGESEASGRTIVLAE
jgi:hypothetical protein